VSGGSYDYAYWKVDEFAGSMRCGEQPGCPDGTHAGAWDADCRRCKYSDQPGCADYVDTELRKKFRSHLRRVSEAMRAIEWNDSGDGASNEADLIRACLEGE
jgi:hypothetical protein